MVFDRKLDFQSELCAMCEAAKLGKASKAYNRWGWLILRDLLKDLLKNWVAEGVAFDSNDFKFPIL